MRLRYWEVESFTHLLPVNFQVGDVTLEGFGDVQFGEVVLGEDGEETSLPAATVPDDCQLPPDRSHCLDSRDLNSKERCSAFQMG